MRAADWDEAQGEWIHHIPSQEYYSVQEVSTILDTGGPSVRNSIKRGTIKAYKVNGVVKVQHDDLLAYIARRQAIPTAGELVIEEIVPESKRKQAKVAAELVDDEDIDEDDLAFLDEED